MSVLGDDESSDRPPRPVHESEALPEASGIEYFRSAWGDFAAAQTEAIIVLIKDESNQVEDVLRLTEEMPSLQSM